LINGLWSATGRVHRQLMVWQGVICVDLQDMEFDLPEGDFAETMRDVV